MTDTATLAPKTTADGRTLEDVLQELADAHVKVVTETVVPFVTKTTGITFDGELTGRAAMVNGVITTTIGFTYPNAYADPFVLANRIIFEGMLNAFLEDYKAKL